MKTKTVSVVLFLITFIVVYLITSFAIPGMRIKLAAEPLEYFIESVGHMVFIKTAASLAAALVVGAIPLGFRAKE